MANASGKRKGLRKGRPPGRRARKNRQAAIEADPVSLELWEIMGQFSQALSLVIVCHRSLEAQPSAGVGDEEETLRRAIRLLKDVYNEIDRVSFATTKTQRRPSSPPARQTAASPVR
jgi:hypothetical protein